MKFQKKPVVINAIQWTGDNIEDVLMFTGKHPKWDTWFKNMDDYIHHVRLEHNTFKVFTLEGVMTANQGDWIIRGVKGEHYPCKPDIFEATYELIEE